MEGRAAEQRAAVLAALDTVKDPDLRQGLVALGFIRDLTLSEGHVSFELRLTTPACPAKEELERSCWEAVSAIDGVRSVTVHTTANTLWSARGELEGIRRVRNIVIVASGKGGVGKSTTTVNLGWALAEAGASVGLLDADIHGPSLGIMTGVGVPTEMEGDLAIPPTVDEIAVVSMSMFSPAGRANVLRGPRVTAVVRQFLERFQWGELDYLLVDTPPGTGDVPLTLAQLAPIAGVVLVTTPQQVAIADTRRSARMFAELDIPVLGVVETMSAFVCDRCGHHHALHGEGGAEGLAADIGARVIGRIPFDGALGRSSDEGLPLVRHHPDAPGAVAYRRASGALAARLSTMHHESATRSAEADSE